MPITGMPKNAYRLIFQELENPAERQSMDLELEAETERTQQECFPSKEEETRASIFLIPGPESSQYILAERMKHGSDFLLWPCKFRVPTLSDSGYLSSSSLEKTCTLKLLLWKAAFLKRL